MGVRGSEKVCTSSPFWESRRWRAQELKTRTICWIMFRRITQVTIHQSADDNQPPNGGLSLADASLVLTEPIKSRMGGLRSNDVLGSSQRTCHRSSECVVF